MIRAYLLFIVLGSSVLSLVSFFRRLPLAVMLTFPLAAGILCAAAGAVFLFSALTVPSDQAAGLLAAGGLGLLAALNLGAAIRAIIRRR
jgi:hypothetical protein